jgi:hypothetical protein
VSPLGPYGSRCATKSPWLVGVAAAIHALITVWRPQVVLACNPLEQKSRKEGPGMTRYQAVRQDLDLVSAAPFPHEFHVGLVILLAKRRMLSAVSPLSDVVGQTRCDDTCESGYERRRSSPRPPVNNWVWCPRDPCRECEQKRQGSWAGSHHLFTDEFPSMPVVQLPWWHIFGIAWSRDLPYVRLRIAESPSDREPMVGALAHISREVLRLR